MSNTTFPTVSLGRQDHAQLKKLAQTAKIDGHPVAGFLLSEIRRARVFEQDSLETVVGPNKQITYRIDFGPTKSQLLVLSENCAATEVSVLSSLGTAMLGLKEGDRMPDRDVFGALHFVKIIRIEAPLPGFVSSASEEGPFDPGPQAA
jgi:regulator of nucleoside diphosphate kinase